MKKNLSGSLNYKELDQDLADAFEELDAAIAEGKDDKEIVNKFLEKVLESAFVEESLMAMAQPEHILSDKKSGEWLFFVNAATKFMEPVRNNAGATVLGLYDDKNFLCSINKGTFIVPKRYVKKIGLD